MIEQKALSFVNMFGVLGALEDLCAMDDKAKIMLDIDKIREKIKEIKILILSQEKMLDEIESDEI